MTERDLPSIRLVTAPSAAAVAELDAALIRSNQMAGVSIDRAAFLLEIRNEAGTLLAGLHATTFLGWLAIALLWVAESHRGKGYGSALLTRAEQIGRERGCSVGYLSTFSFQAPDFYHSRGYSTFGVLPNPATGISRHYLLKELTRSPENDAGIEGDQNDGNDTARRSAAERTAE